MPDILDVGGQDRPGQQVSSVRMRHCPACEVEAREYRCFVCGRFTTGW